MLRNDLGTLAGRYRRFCIVAARGASDWLLLRRRVEPKQTLLAGMPATSRRLSLRDWGCLGSRQLSCWFAWNVSGFGVGQITSVETYVPNQIGYGKHLPHITVGVAKFDDLKLIEAGPFDAFGVHPSSVSVYHLGNNGTARAELKSWGRSRANSS